MSKRRKNKKPKSQKRKDVSKYQRINNELFDIDGEEMLFVRTFTRHLQSWFLKLRANATAKGNDEIVKLWDDALMAIHKNEFTAKEAIYVVFELYLASKKFLIISNDWKAVPMEDAVVTCQVLLGWLLIFKKIPITTLSQKLNADKTVTDDIEFFRIVESSFKESYLDIEDNAGIRTASFCDSAGMFWVYDCTR